MKFLRSPLSDVIICEPQIHGDDRGYFFESFRQDKLEAFIGYKLNFCQDNESKSNKGVVRGLHYQLPPFEQTKLVRVISGRVLDIVVDIRKHSPTFGNHFSIELSAKNKRQIFVPKGFLHGYAVLEDNTIFSYKVDTYYSPEHDRGIRYNDPNLDINWMLDTKDILLSQKDKTLPFFNSLELQ